ncbi:hypothetical protein PVAND_008158 [Polypedilum vanderplanki]|uniref:PDZ domain-containing protein n=1 Tax=Polypedilum vanderplanki TaxID=319348 RepID=A0A9J6C8U1_POLVA|nr:hypothetical protein PVAND_008158 [Polypedilum vanderplanki]
MSSIYSMHRPGFWRIPQSKNQQPEHLKKKVHFKDEYYYVHPNSPAERELMRGDIITKVEDYDARDLRHEDAQMLFRTQDNKIRLVVRRDNKIAMNSSKSKPISSMAPPNVQPSYIPPINQHPYRVPSPIPRGPQNMTAACASPLESLPHTVFPNDNQYHQVYQYTPIAQQQQQQSQQQHVNYPPPPPRTCFSPQLTRDHYQASDDENASLQYQLLLGFSKFHNSRKKLKRKIRKSVKNYF